MEPALLIVAAAIVAYGPAYIANMAPPLAKSLRLPGAKPIWPRRLGTHKTYRGLFSGIGAGAVTGAVLHWLHLGWYGTHDAGESAAAGALIGLAAMVGDALKSAAKRAVGVPAGQPFVPWDQIDFIIGASLLVLPLGIAGWPEALAALLITPVLHLLVNVGAYLVGLKEVWW
ncbi:MAG: CDP-archaeol synthase [Candidatus Peribacteraceae bacterium]|nr:CDP-archaeol synthase [Candidatus Peribacteraceae bacterium]